MIVAVLWLALLMGPAPAPEAKEGPRTEFWLKVKGTIEHYLGLPYVWGASGQKGFDCSGFVWRVHWENGALVKRTTARKFYMCLPPVGPGEQWTPGTIVFFDDLKHCGIVRGRDTFYHAESSKGTNLSKFDPYWRKKIYGFRKMPAP